MAEYMFKELGFELVRNDDDYIIYEKHLGNCSKVVSFCEQNRSVNVTYDNLVIISSDTTPPIDMNLFRAIDKQLNELSWI